MDGQDKLLAPLAGRPLLAHTLRAFEACDAIGQVVVVLSDANADAVLPVLRQFKKVTRTGRGGARRQDSVRNGLYSLVPFDWIVVHDGARPLVTPGLISHGIALARDTGAATAAVPVVDTLKAAREDGTIIRTVPREGLWAVQTPQVFRYDLLLAAHERITIDVTDDCAMVEQLGHPVHLYEGSRLNLKVTTPEDLLLADALLRARRKN
jgi:2-C-methyl-D-erythritol 4-phosphate cytidylyltransferase